MTTTIRVYEAFDIDGEQFDSDDLNRLLALDGTNDWPGRDEAMREVEESDIYGDDLEELEDEQLAAYLILARTEEKPTSHIVTSCGAALEDS